MWQYRQRMSSQVTAPTVDLTVHLRSIDDLPGLLDRFLVYGETTTSLINASPIPRRDPPLDERI